jgi:deoxyribodipyrimidine photo-lyase
MSVPSTLVWFKRDLRVHDHAPLVAAQSFAAALGLYVIEPEWLASPDCDAMHVDFALACVTELRQDLAKRGLPLVVRVGNAEKILTELRAQFHFTHLLSHEETGSGWSYQRDLAVGAWCKKEQIVWQEFTQTGVIRALASRNSWAQKWQARMSAPLAVLSQPLAGHSGIDLGDIPDLSSLGLSMHSKTLQAAGERAARQCLRSFLQGRGRDYRKAISSPLSAQDGCSRLSPHLAFGTLSMRTLHQAIEACMNKTEDRQLAFALSSFAGRLRWHCHFMQKLESEPAIEFANFSRACDGLRPGDIKGGAAPFSAQDEINFQAWCTGHTGYPMVDACMRSLVATGWLNFRMRAMLVSFASSHLWLHWRSTGEFLARQFLDFEPGIHWSQMQMQSGTTGINTLRIYSPAKQAQDQDPEGIFIRQWVPELARVPLAYLAKPWTMPAPVQQMSNCIIGTDYPAPIVDEKLALKHAKDKLYTLRESPQAKQQALRVLNKHGSRKSGLPPSDKAGARQKKVAVQIMQGDLFA